MGTRPMRFLRSFFSACVAAGLCAAIVQGALRAEPAAGAGFAVAQTFRAPPADVGDESYGQAQQDSSSLLLRIDRLESQMRQLNGAIEQLQFQNRKLEEQLRKFQEDVEFRLQESGRSGGPASAAKPQKRGEAIDRAAPEDLSAGPLPGQGGAVAPFRPAKRADAFNPDADPTAPGAPRALGSAASAAPLPGRARTSAETDVVDPEAPLDLSGARWRAGQGAAGQNVEESARGGGVAPAMPGNSSIAALSTPAGAAAGAPVNPVKEEFDVAFGYYRQKEYETAEKSFAAFIQKNPKSRMTADATYYLGESFFQRNRPREAAEQYLKISTLYANSPHAPDAMLRLGQSLSALGAREQACATFAEIQRKYPNAAPSVKAGADREAKRVQC